MSRSGRVRGRPRPLSRGTRVPSNTGPSWVLSWRWPGVIAIESGRPLPSQARWTLVVSPPRLRPIPSSGRCWTPFLRQPDSADAARHWHAGAHGRWCCPDSPPRRHRQQHPSESARAPESDPRSHLVASDRGGPRTSARDRITDADYGRAFTVSQAFHWMDPTATLAEIARILRPGGLFAVYD
jgi:hypothetical protein